MGLSGRSLKALGTIPDTLRANSGRIDGLGERAGFHLYFNYPTGVGLRSRVGTLGRGLDVRATGGYVVAPPSRHCSGLHYEWASVTNVIEDFPGLLIDKCAVPVGTRLPTIRASYIYEGERDVKLYRLAVRWRRQGASTDDLVSRLGGFNHNFCRPPVDVAQVLKIAMSAARVAVGSPDPLDVAWERARAENCWHAYDKVLAIIRHLGSDRPGCPILLPVERIGKLVGCDRTLVGRCRKRAIDDGFIKETERYVAHQKATQFTVLKLPPLWGTTNGVP
jgi:hypothetical protein